jgi:hypothetical protein
VAPNRAGSYLPGLDSNGDLSRVGALVEDAERKTLIGLVELVARGGHRGRGRLLM